MNVNKELIIYLLEQLKHKDKLILAIKKELDSELTNFQSTLFDKDCQIKQNKNEIKAQAALDLKKMLGNINQLDYFYETLKRNEQDVDVLAIVIPKNATMHKLLSDTLINIALN